MRRSIILPYLVLICFFLPRHLLATQAIIPPVTLDEKQMSADRAFTEGDISRALELNLEILEKDPRNLQAKQMIGFINYKARHFDQAQQYFTRILKEHGELFFPLLHLGNIYLTRSMPVNALSYYKRALALKPKDELLIGNIHLAEETIANAYLLSKHYRRSTLAIWLGGGAGLITLILILLIELKASNRKPTQTV